jgi:hypothetical protein
MGDGLAHREPLRRGLLARDDHIDAVVGAQDVIGDPEQGVRIRGQIDADDVGLLVCDEIDKAGILVAETVMVLAPDMRRQEII